MAEVPPTYKSYVIDLDVAPRQRWAHVVQDNLEALSDMAEAYNVALVHEFGLLAPIANALAGMVSVPPVFKEEMLGLAEASGGRLTYGLVTRMNIGYDFVAKCTSAGVKAKGTTYHLRNMDWDMGILRRLTVLVRFVKGGRTVHQGITWVGFVGTYTQMSSQGYSLSLNYRKVGTNNLTHMCGALLLRRQSLGFVVRLLLERELPFNAFVSELLAADLIAPCYLTVVGSEQAMVVTRGKLMDEECRHLEPCGSGGEVVIQTNHDPWRTVEGNRFFLSDKAWPAWAEGDELLLDTKARYACALQGIKGALAQHASAAGAGSREKDGGGEGDGALLAGLSRVLRTEPVKNSQTVYGVIMIPSRQLIVPVN